MKLIHQLISEEAVYALGWTVLHSLWQAMVIALIMALLFLAMPKQKATLRYAIGNSALVLLLLMSLGTFFWYYDQTNPLVTSDLLIITRDSAHFNLHYTPQWGSSFFHYFDQHVPFIVSVWILGMAFFTLRLMGSLIFVQHLKSTHHRPMPDLWQDKLETLAKKVGLNKTVTFVESSLIRVPMVVGYLKPMILMPIGAVNALEMDEVEAILAHELAHISRNDYLLNIFQSVVEVLYYFNPAVWWISANIRTERENCCDDIAIELCGNPLTYAKALVNLQNMYHTPPQLAVSFNGRKNQLLNRIRRILNQPQNRSNIMEKCMATTLLLLLFTVLSISANHFEQADNLFFLSQVENPEYSIEHHIQDTVPAARWQIGKNRISYSHDGQSIQLESEDGVITGLVINGDVIPKEDIPKHQSLIEEILENLPPPPPAPPAPPAPPVLPAPTAMPAPPTPPTPPAPPAPAAPVQKTKVIKGKDKTGRDILILEREKGEGHSEIIIHRRVIPGRITLNGKGIQFSGEINVNGSPGQAHRKHQRVQVRLASQQHLPTDTIKNEIKLLQEQLAREAEIMAREMNIYQEEMRSRELALMEKMSTELNLQLKEELEMLEREKMMLKEEKLAELKEMQEQLQKEMLEKKRSLQYELELQTKEMQEAREMMEREENIARELNGNQHDAVKELQKALIQDGLINPAEKYHLILDSRHIEINGQALSDKQYRKYISIYQKRLGGEINDSFKIEISKNGKKSKSGSSL